MLELYRTENKDVYEKLKKLLAEKSGENFEINRTLNGKPYIGGDPLFFSLSHSRGNALIAISDKPVGIDIEYFKDGFGHVLSRFSEREKADINCDKVKFFCNWVAKEAYIKLLGGTLAHYLKRLEYFGNKLYCDGKEVNCGLFVSAEKDLYAFAVCAEGYTEGQISERPIKIF